MKIFSAFNHILRRDLLLAYRSRSEIVNPLLFFIVIIALFPLAINPNPSVLKTIGAGIIWIAALLATLLGLDNLFRSDFEDGSLELLLLSPQPLSILLMAKIIAHWCVTGLPLIIISPLLGILLHLTPHAILILMLSLLLGTPTLSFIGAIGIALTVSLRQGGVLLSLVIMPLYVPVLIFGAGAVVNAMTNIPATAELLLLAALLVLTFTLAPLAAAGALRATIS